MDKHQKRWNETIAAQIIANLQQRNMDGSYAQTAAQAKQEVLAMLPTDAKVYRGGSMTTVELDLWPAIAKIPGVQLIDPYRSDVAPEVNMAARRTGLLADVMIASSNAITLDGKLVNLDGRGNRVAAMLFGPEKVILLVGMNKVAPDLDTAMARVKHQAAPINATRLGLKTPCVASGRCSDCKSAQRICNMWGIIEGHAVKGRIHVKLVGENLGY